jgi:hypothetical protein
MAMETGLWKRTEVRKNQRDHEKTGAVRRFSTASPAKMGLKVFDCGSALSIPGQFRRSDVVLQAAPNRRKSRRNDLIV